MVIIGKYLFLYLVYILTDLHELWRHEAFTSSHMLDDFNIHGHYWGNLHVVNDPAGNSGRIRLKTETLGENPDLLPLCCLQIRHFSLYAS